MGPPGSFKKENALFLADHMGWKCISTGDVLRKEVTKKTEAGQKIKTAFSEYRFGKLVMTLVEDDIVIDLI
jgi:adenylate kinase family enzyme